MAAKSFAEFYGFNPEEPLAFFPKLLVECPISEEPSCNTSVEDVSWVAEAIRPIRTLCEAFQFEVLLADLTIIQDERLIQRDQEDPYLVNHLVSYRDRRTGSVSEPTVINAYRAAMNYMATDEAGRDPLVPHPLFYQYAYLATPVAEHADFKNLGTATPGALCQSCCRQRYVYERGPGRQDPQAQLGRLLGAFLRNLGEGDEGLRAEFGGAVFLAVPFHRSPYKPAMSGQELIEGGAADLENEARSSSDQQSASPGGGVFLLVKPAVAVETTDWQGPIERLACSLQSLLTRAALTESFSRLNVQLTYNDLLSTMLHGAVHVVRGIGAGDLCRAVSRRTPPEGPEDFYSPAFREDRRSAESLVSALKRAVLGENIADAMLSFAEMSFDRGFAGELREKFQNTEAATVADLIQDARDLVNHAASRRVGKVGSAVPVIVDHLETGPDGPSDGCWMIPPGYVDTRLLMGVFAEVLRNASQYGKRQHDGQVAVECRINANEARDGLVCIFSNESTSPRKDSADVVGGFLRRMGRVFSQFPGLNLGYSQQSDNDRSTFTVKVTLGTVKSLNERMQSQAIPPLWSRK